MIKIRGPFPDRIRAQGVVDAMAAQGVPFREFQECEVPASGRLSGLLGPKRSVIFAVYDDPAADWPDEEIVLDEAKGWIVKRPK